MFSREYHATIPTDGISLILGGTFQAASIVVDNYTPHWLYLKLANSYVSPYTIGAIINYAPNHRIETIVSHDPVGVPTAPVTGFPDGGVGIFLTTDSLAQSLGLVYAAAPATPPTVTVSPPIVSGLPQMGFAVDFLATIITVGVAPTPCPAVVLANRRALCLQSPVSNTDTIYIGGVTVTADETATGGLQMDPGQTFPIDAASAIVYAIATVATQKLIVLEGT